MQIRKVIISQSAPKVIQPYDELSSKSGISIDFIPFFTIQPVSSMEFRAQRCNVTDYSAIVFSSRTTIDAFFSICEELRIKVPDTMKYFCTNEKVANYLQKHIVYRKRKIFFGDGTPSSILGLITAKHKDDNFLIITSDSLNNSVTKVFEGTAYKFSSAMFAKSVPSDLSKIDINSYDAIVMYNKTDVASIKQNFPGFVQGERAIITYGTSASLKAAIADAGFKETLNAPSQACPSVIAALESLIDSK